MHIKSIFLRYLLRRMLGCEIGLASDRQGKIANLLSSNFQDDRYFSVQLSSDCRLPFFAAK